MNGHEFIIKETFFIGTRTFEEAQSKATRTYHGESCSSGIRAMNSIVPIELSPRRYETFCYTQGGQYHSIRLCESCSPKRWLSNTMITTPKNTAMQPISIYEISPTFKQMKNGKFNGYFISSSFHSPKSSILRSLLCFCLFFSTFLTLRLCSL